MRRILLVAVASLALCSTALARDVSINLPVDAQQATRNLPGAFDQCIAGVTLRNDAAVCKTVANFLGALANEVTSAQAKADAEDKAKAEAEKKKADDKAPKPK